MDKFGEFLRTAVRPFLVIGSFIALLAAEFEGIDLSIPFKTFAFAVIAEWPVERAVKRVKEKS